MQHHQKQYRKEPRKIQPKRNRDENALKNVVSLRISDEEKRILEKITKSTSKNVSEIVREAIEFWLAKRRRYCFES